MPRSPALTRLAALLVALALAASFLIPSPASVNKAEPAAKD